MDREPKSRLLLPLGISAFLGGLVAVVFLIWSGQEKSVDPSDRYLPLRSVEPASEPRDPLPGFSFDTLRRDPEVLATNLRRFLEEDLVPSYLEAQSYELGALGMRIDAVSRSAPEDTPSQPELSRQSEHSAGPEAGGRSGS